MTGLKVRVLDGEEEARLSFRSALAHFDLGVGRTVVMDIGGGSLELALSADGVVDRLASLPFGALRLTERISAKGITPKAVRRLRRDVARRTSATSCPRRDWRGAQLIGSGGTFTNLAGIHLARQGMLTARSVHADAHSARGARAHSRHARRHVRRGAARRAGAQPGRADIIVAGLAVAAEVLRAPRERASSSSRATAFARGCCSRPRASRRPSPTPARRASGRCAEFAERCHYEEPHSSHVQRLALQLFDALGARLGCAPADRDALADAALLHDVGYHISYERHHKHSYHLILHADLLGMSPAEQVVIANVARYHRGAPPKRKHRNFGMLDKSLRRRIKRLSAHPARGGRLRPRPRRRGGAT